MKLQFGYLSPKDLVTLASAASAVASMIFSLRAEYALAAGAVALSALLDFADGIVARASREGGDEFGKQLDSLADIVAFGAAPVVIVLSQGISFLSGLAASVFVLAGVIRLARFNLQVEKGVFFGLPIPVAGLLVAVTAVFAHYLAVAVMLLAGLAMVSNVRIEKISLK